MSKHPDTTMLETLAGVLGNASQNSDAPFSPNKPEGVGAVREWRGKQIPIECPYPALGAIGAPSGYDIDPGAGSASDRFQREWPSRYQVGDLHNRDGRVIPLYSASTVTALQEQIASLRARAEKAEPSPSAGVNAGEAAYQESCRAIREELAGEPADLAGALRMLDQWGPEALPANENGQVPFGRALLDSAAEAIRKHLSTVVPPETGWRTMETAPKDGTRVVLYAPGCLTMVGAWLEKTGRVYPPAWWSNNVPILPEPTRWWPIPAPPAPETKEGGEAAIARASAEPTLVERLEKAANGDDLESLVEVEGEVVDEARRLCGIVADLLNRIDFGHDIRFQAADFAHGVPSAEPTPAVTISPHDPRVIIEGIREFGLAADGSDLRDLEAALSLPQTREAAR